MFLLGIRYVYLLLIFFMAALLSVNPIGDNKGENNQSISLPNYSYDGKLGARYYDLQRDVSIKVLFDNGHGQYYNASKLSQFLRDIERTFWVEVDINYGTLSDALLSNYGILILVDIDESIGLTTDEITAIKNFIYGGGALLITATKAAYFDPAYFNQITSEFGIEWLDVTVYDLDDYDYREDYPLVHTWGNNELADKLSDNGTYTIKMQSTSLSITSADVQIIGTGDTDPAGDATFANDSSGNIVVTGTDVVFFAAVDIADGGRIFASGGTNFLLTSQYLYLNFDFDNKMFALGVFEWLLEEFVDDATDVIPESSDTIKLFCNPDNAYRVLEDFIMSANETVYFNVYQFTHDYIYGLLKNLTTQKPSVKIVAIIERYPVAGQNSEQNYYYADKLVNELGATVKWANEDYYYVSHAKYIIIDNKSLMILTGNFKPVDFSYNNNSNGNRDFGVIINNEYVVDLFLEVFLNDFDIAQEYYAQNPQLAGSVDSPGTYVPKFQPTTVTTTAKYLPMLGPESVYYHMKRLIRDAKHFIYMLFPYTRNNSRLLTSLLDELGAAVQRGVTVLAIINSGETETKDMLERRGINVIYIPSDLGLHTKAIIIDDKIIYIGSSNWSNTGLGITSTPNREEGIAIFSTDVAVYFRDVFGYDWERKTGAFDTDGDGLSDIYEQNHGLDIYDTDSDDDGYNDWEEVVIYESDPLNPSSPSNGPPTIEVINPENNSVLNTSTILVEWNASDEDGIDYNEIRLDDGTWINVGKSTQYTFYDVPDGDHVIYIRSTDTKGDSNTTQIIVSISEPPKVIFNEPVSGGSYNYTIYSAHDTVVIGWSADDNSGIDHTEVRIDGGSWVSIGNVSCYEITGLLEGYHTIDIKVVDVYDNYNISTIGVIVDFTPPNVEYSSNSYTLNSAQSEVTISWSGTDSVGIAYYLVKIGDGEWQYVGKNTSISIDNSLSDGIYTVYLKAVDLAGNYNITYTMLIVDRINPTLGIVSPNNQSYLSSTTLTITWSMDDNMVALASICIDGGEWVYLGRQSNYQTALNEGQHTIDIKAEDIAGNIVVSRLVIYIDTTPPQISIITPSDGEVLTTSQVIIQWSGEDNFGIDYYLVRIDSGDWIKTYDTTYTVTLVDGTHTIVVKGVDKAGNVDEKSVVIYVNTNQAHTSDCGCQYDACRVDDIAIRFVVWSIDVHRLEVN